MRMRACLALLLAVGCGGGHNPDRAALEKISSAQILGVYKYEILDDASMLVARNGEVSGVGKVRFGEVLDGAKSAYHYSIKFRLDEDGSLILVSHADAKLAGGFELHFVRHGGVLEVMAKTARKSVNWTRYFASIPAQREIELGIDLHNDHGARSHLIFWDTLTGNVLFDSGRSIHAAPGRGLGAEWGLQLKGATVYDIKKGAPKHAH